MMDLQEAIKSCDFYTRLLDLTCSRYRFVLGLDEASKQFEPQSTDLNQVITDLELSHRESLVLSILLSEEMAKEAAHLVCKPGELAELLEAKNRMSSASQKAGALLEEHQQKEAAKNAPPQKSATAAAIDAFLEKEKNRRGRRYQ